MPIISSEASGKARFVIIEQQPAPIRLYIQFPCTDTYTTICTNCRKPSLDSYVAQAFTVHYSTKLKNFPDFQKRNNLRKILAKCYCDSQRRNALRCGIDAKVRRKNEIARDLKKKIRVLIRKQGIQGRNPRVWRIKPVLNAKDTVVSND